jgi:hypothetical protein
MLLTIAVGFMLSVAFTVFVGFFVETGRGE